jgi:hypothetical protein
MPLYGGRANNGVRQFWFLLAGLAGALVMIGVTIGGYLLDGHHPKTSLHLNPTALTVVAIALGIVGQVLVRVVDPPLNGSSESSLVATYRARFFLWVGVGEAPAFIALVFAIATNHFWIYPVGLLFALLSFVRIAPTARHLAKDQRRLDQSGTPCSLVVTIHLPGRLRPKTGP